jgi:hypothetical protein
MLFILFPFIIDCHLIVWINMVVWQGLWNFGLIKEAHWLASVINRIWVIESLVVWS